MRRARDPIVLGELIHAEDGDDVLEILVELQDSLHATRDRVVLLADDLPNRLHSRQSAPRIERCMYSSNRGTVNAVSP